MNASNQPLGAMTRVVVAMMVMSWAPAHARGRETFGFEIAPGATAATPAPPPSSVASADTHAEQRLCSDRMPIEEGRLRIESSSGTRRYKVKIGETTSRWTAWAYQTDAIAVVSVREVRPDGSHHDVVRGVDRETGRTLWRSAEEGGLRPHCFIVDPSHILVDTNGAVELLDVRTGRHNQAPVAYDGGLVGAYRLEDARWLGRTTTEVFVWDIASGAVQWRQPARGRGLPVPTEGLLVDPWMDREGPMLPHGSGALVHQQSVARVRWLDAATGVLVREVTVQEYASFHDQARMSVAVASDGTVRVETQFVILD